MGHRDIGPLCPYVPMPQDLWWAHPLSDRDNRHAERRLPASMQHSRSGIVKFEKWLLFLNKYD